MDLTHDRDAPDHLKTRCLRLIHAVLMVLVACAPGLGCASAVRTPIDQGPDHAVALEWMPDESFRASHPATISPTTLRRVLTGLFVQPPKGLVDRLSGQEREPAGVLSDEDVELLLPALVSALAQATPEERVVFRRVYAYDLGSDSTAGHLYVRGNLILVTLTQYARNPGRPDIRYVDNRRAPGSIGLADSTLQFVPQDAWVTRQSRPQAATPTVAIDYSRLSRLPEPTDRSPADGRSRQTEGVPGPVPDDVRLHGLEEQVHRQEQELEQLKRSLRELRRERGE